MGSIPEEALEPHGDRFVRDSVADGIPEWMRRGVHGLGHFAFVHREKIREMNVVSFANFAKPRPKFFQECEITRLKMINERGGYELAQRLRIKA